MSTSGYKNIPRKILPEELLFSLPDYIRGTLDDKELEGRIKSELNTNPDLMKEYTKLSEVLSFVGKTNLEEPPAHYFNTLLPRINERIHAGDAKEKSIFSIILSYWKYAVPALTVFLIIIIYNIGFRNTSFYEVPQVIAPGHYDSIIPGIDKGGGNSGELRIDSTNIQEMTSEKTSGTEQTAMKTAKDKKIKGFKEKNGSAFDITEIFSTVSDEEVNDADEVEMISLESEFSTLPANEQNDILQKIKKL